MDYNIATIITSQMLEMVKSGEIDERIEAAMSAKMVVQMRNLTALFKQSSLSEGDINDILEDAKNEFLKPFKG